MERMRPCGRDPPRTMRSFLRLFRRSALCFALTEAASDGFVDCFALLALGGAALRETVVDLRCCCLGLGSLGLFRDVDQSR